MAAADLKPEVGPPILPRHEPKIGALTPYAVAARHPEGPEVNEPKAAEALEIARALAADIAAAMPSGGTAAARG